VLLPYVAGWRWMHEGNHSVWYDSLTLHRQRGHGDWTAPKKNLKSALESRLTDNSLRSWKSDEQPAPLD
jgi:hypothetical protein